MKGKILIIGLSCIFIACCATLFKGGLNEVNFNSDPQRAKVYCNGGFIGETPLAIKLDSNKSYMIEIRKEGYRTHTQNITNHIGAGWIILDILGGLIPVIVDAATGDWYSLDQKNINAVLLMEQTKTTQVEPLRLQQQVKAVKKVKTEKAEPTKRIIEDVIETAEQIDHKVQKLIRHVKIIIDKTEVRLTPSQNGQVIATLSFGTIINAVGTTGDWYAVEIPSAQEGVIISGYVHKYNIQFVK